MVVRKIEIRESLSSREFRVRVVGGLGSGDWGWGIGVEGLGLRGGVVGVGVEGVGVGY